MNGFLSSAQVPGALERPGRSRCPAGQLSPRAVRILVMPGKPGEARKPRTPRARVRSGASRTVGNTTSDDDGEHVARREHQVLLAGVADLGAAVLGVQHHVALGDVDRDAVALVVDPARADGEDGALLRLLLGGVGNDDAGRGGGLGLQRLDDDAVLQRLDVDLGGGHAQLPSWGLTGMECRCDVRPAAAVAGVSHALTSTLALRVPTLNTGSGCPGAPPAPAAPDQRKLLDVQVRPASVVVQTVVAPPSRRGPAQHPAHRGALEADEVGRARAAPVTRSVARQCVPPSVLR